MSRSHRRRFEKMIPQILQRAGRQCGLCGARFESDVQVFAGFSRSDRIVLTGECCRPALFSVHATGTYSPDNGLPIQLARTQLELQLDAWVPADEPTDASPSQGGDLLPRLTPVSPATEAEHRKADDSAWFIDNPNRAHRLRPAYARELAALSAPLDLEGLPQQHCWEMLVRQVGNGRCVRLAFCRDAQTSVPDVEAVIRDIFDAVSRPSASGYIQSQEIAEIVCRHQPTLSVEVA
jgi:hypothetical protein